MSVGDLHLPPTCGEVLNYLEDNPDGCSTVNELTRISGTHHSNWATISKCLEKLKQEGYVHPDEKCVQKAHCFRFRRNRQYADLQGDCTIDNVENFIESNTRVGRKNLYLPRLDEPLDPFYQKVGDSLPKHARPLGPDVPV